MIIDVKVTLASRSPRRHFLLGQIVKELETISLDTDESFADHLPAEEVAPLLAQRKMDDALSRGLEGIIVTADTIVVLGGQILNKPADEAEARKMLGMLSGNEHTVVTGFSIVNTETGRRIDSSAKTLVRFTHLTKDEIDGYIATGSPYDKAGGYGVQDGYGSIFMESITGCYYNVMGLPTNAVYKALKKVLS